MVEYLAGKYGGETSLRVVGVETEPPHLADVVVSFTWQCPVEMELEDRIRVFADAYHLDCQVIPSGSKREHGRNGVIVHLKTR